MTDRTSFPQFYEELLAADAAGSAVLWSWLDPARALLEPLRAYGAWDAHARTYWRGHDGVDEKMIQDVQQFYAFSRVSDILLLPFQSGAHDGSSWAGPTIGPAERMAFFTSLGLERINKLDFHPFFHEIVTVEQANDAASPIVVVDELWQGFMLDHLLICRAGVHVRGGANHINKEVAEGSTLYWAFRRKNRPYRDLSQGWGSNSQWRTEFRRDYTDGRTFVYNADSTLDARLPAPGPRPNPAREGLPVEARIELLINRCFVHTSLPDDDLFPYNDTLRISR